MTTPQYKCVSTNETKRVFRLFYVGWNLTTTNKVEQDLIQELFVKTLGILVGNTRGVIIPNSVLFRSLCEDEVELKREIIDKYINQINEHNQQLQSVGEKLIIGDITIDLFTVLLNGRRGESETIALSSKRNTNV